MQFIITGLLVSKGFGEYSLHPTAPLHHTSDDRSKDGNFSLLEAGGLGVGASNHLQMFTLRRIPTATRYLK